jgi:hypothetical protein
MAKLVALIVEPPQLVRQMTLKGVLAEEELGAGWALPLPLEWQRLPVGLLEPDMPMLVSQ